MHAFGHAALALAAGGCARALVGGWVEVGKRSTAWGAHVDALLFACLGLAAVIVKGIGGMYATYGQTRIAAAAEGALRLEVLDGLLSVHRLRQAGQSDHGPAVRDPSDPSDQAPGSGPQARGVAALTSHVREVGAGLATGLLGGLRAAVQLAALAAALVWISPRLAVAALVVLVPFSALVAATRHRWKRAHRKAGRQSEALLEAADEAVRHADLWATYGAESKVRAHVESLGDAIGRHVAKLEASAAALSAANEVLGGLALVGALSAARAGWLGDAGSGGVLLSFTVTFFLAYKPLRELADARLAFLRADAAFVELRGLLVTAASKTPPDPLASEGASRAALSTPSSLARRGKGGGVSGDRHEVAWPLGGLHVRGIRLRFGTDDPVSFSIRPGHIVAVVGPSGTGKTTLLRTLLGLESPRSGEILYAGAPLTDAPPGPRTRPFAWVPQEAPLLADTLAANVSLGGQADPHEALARVGALHLTEQLADERLGGGGRAVSGGERQWIALARAIATRQPILLLDEPTSGLDPEAQRRVLEAILRLRGKRSVVIVTHRPEPLAVADEVVRLGAQAERCVMTGPAVTVISRAFSASPSST